MPKKWVIKDSIKPSDELVQYVGSPLVAQILAQRGIIAPEKAEKFLKPETFEPISPYSYIDMDKAVSRLKSAVENKENILIYGDFDADGITSTAVMYKTLKYLGANFSYYIPDRQTESHGIKSGILLKKISKEHVKLVVTVDCGISNTEEVELAKTFGTDVIITDHHESKEELPKAFAVLDAKAPGSVSENLTVDELTSLASMAGVGAAFKLCCALLEEYGKINFIDELLPLVAVGTVGDIMPLLYENRLFVTLGMKLIKEDKNKGIMQLLKVAGVKSEEITADKIAFQIVPRINAAGRLDDAETAFKLLVSDNLAELAIYAQTLNNLNGMRQELADKTYLEAVEYIEKNSKENDSVLFAYNPQWHIGIVGIVASRLTETFNKPAFVFTDSVDSACYRASIRSVEGINIFRVIDENANLIASYGGHSMAAGLMLDKKTIDLNTFKDAVNKSILEQTGGEILEPKLYIDAEMSANDLSVDFCRDLEKLEPCGAGNNVPLFAIKNLKLVSERAIGQEKNHLKFNCSDKQNNILDCIMWKHSSLNIPMQSDLDIAFYPKINEFNGSTSVQLDVCDYKSDSLKQESIHVGRKIIDHRKKTGILPQVEDYIKSSDGSFKIFAENKDIQKSLALYSEISQNIITRLNPQTAQQLMFFDYPADEKLLRFVVEKTNPKIIHFMNYNVDFADIDVIISKISGMLKYAVKQYKGEVSLIDIASALSLSDSLIMLVIKLLNRTNVIEILGYNEISKKIKYNFCKPVPLDLLKGHEVYEQCRIELFKSKNYRMEIMNTEDLRNVVKTY